MEIDKDWRGLIIKKCIELTSKSERGLLFMPPPILSDRVEAPDIPPVDITEDPNRSSYTIRSMRSRTGVGSSTVKPRRTPMKEMPNFIHDFTVSHISDSTDTPLYKAPWGLLSDGADYHTPDEIFIGETEIIVIEYTTRSSGSAHVLTRAFNSKAVTYQKELSARVSKVKNEYKVGYFIIAIGPEAVCHNIQGLEDELVDELCFRYNFACSLENKFSDLGVTIKNRDEEYSLSHKKVRAVFESIPLSFGPLGRDDQWNPFTEEFYKRSVEEVKPEDMTVFRNYVESAILKSEADYRRDYNIEDLIHKKKTARSSSSREEGASQTSEMLDPEEVRKSLIKDLDGLVEGFSNTCMAGDRKYSQKAIIQVPFLVPRVQLFDTNLSDPKTKVMNSSLNKIMQLTSDSHDPHLELWYDVCLSIERDEVSRQDSYTHMEDEEIEDIYSKNLASKLSQMGLGLNLTPIQGMNIMAEASVRPVDRIDEEKKSLQERISRAKERTKKILEQKRRAFISSSQEEKRRAPGTENEGSELEETPEQGIIRVEGPLQTKRDYKRVKISYFYLQDHHEFTKLGLSAKKHKDEEVIKEHIKISRKCLKWDVGTDDITEFLSEGPNLFSICCDETKTGSSEIPLELLEESAKIHGVSTVQALDIAVKFKKSYLSRYTAFVSDLATELCISLKQHCKEDEFIIKKLAFYNVFVIISPTRSDSHIFYSLAYLEEDIYPSTDSSGVFKKVISVNNGELRVTEFVSLNKSKLVNLVTLESKILSCFFYFLEFYEVPPQIHGDKLYEFISEPETGDEVGMRVYSCYQQVLFCLMMMMHDKVAAEEAMTQSRYIFMEGFVSYPEFPRPGKMIEKFNTLQRSRLEIFIQKRLISAMYRIISQSFKSFFLTNDELLDDENDYENIERNYLSNKAEERHRTYTGLFDPILQHSLYSPLQLISTWYIGYYKNKEESPEKNSIHQLFDKIVGFEDKFEQRYEYVSVEDPPFEDLKKHEFSAAVVKILTDYSKSILKKTKGDDALRLLEKDILDDLYKVKLEGMATLKATSNFGPEWYSFNPEETYHRGRVMQKVIQELHESDEFDLVGILKKQLELLEDQECMHIDIFRKQQHGGLREIYVLEFPARCVQLAVETIARTICLKFPGETMTHPKNKFLLPANHSKKAKARFSSTPFVTVCTNDDAAKWNQGHFVTKFAVMLLRFTPTFMHGFIFRALRLWMKKRIMIPTDLLKTFLSLGPEDLSNDITNRMKETFLGRNSEFWMSKGSTFIETRTGMMQGILHYTSSLFHVIFQSWLERSIETWSTIMFREVLGFSCQVTTMESSDDSSVIISIPAPDSKTLTEGMKFCSLMFRFKANMALVIGIYDSVKSTKNTLDLLEFNSEFFVGGNLFRPTIRWVTACCSPSEQESFMGRMEEFANLSTSVLEGGACLFTTFMCGVAQGLLHYRLLGSSVCPEFRAFKRGLLECPDPANGFFLLDNVFLSGISGFKYNLWLVTTRTTVGKKMEFILSAISSGQPVVDEESVRDREERVKEMNKEIDDLRTKFEASQASWAEEFTPPDLRAKYNLLDDQFEVEEDIPLTLLRRGFSLDTSEAGNLVNTTLITFGDRKKAQRIIDGLNLPENWREENEDQPEIYFRGSRTREEAVRKIAIKVTSPGVTQSLAKGNAVARIISSSVYVLTQNIVSLTSIWNEGVFRGLTKYRLMELILRDRYNSRDEKGSYKNHLTELQVKTLFPFQEDYKELLEIVSCRASIVGPLISKPRSKKKTDLFVTEHLGTEGYNLEIICKWKWFSYLDRAPLANRVKEEIWREYKSTFPWLRERIDATLASSVFNSYQQLQNFLARCDRKSRTVHLTAAPVASFSGKTNLNSVINQDFFPGMYLSFKLSEGDFGVSNVGIRLKIRLHLIYMLQKSSHPRKTLMIEELLLEDIGLEVGISSSRLRKSYSILQTFSKYEKTKREEDLNSREMYELVRSSKIELIRKIRTLNVGIMGSFTKRQTAKWLNGRIIYTGGGVWMGTLGSVSARLDFESFDTEELPTTYLTRVILSSEYSLEDTLYLIKDLCSESHIVNRLMPGKPNLDLLWKSSPERPYGLQDLCCVFNFKRCTIPKSDNPAVLILDQDFKYDWDSESIMNFEIEASEEAVRLLSVHQHNWLMEKQNPEEYRKELDEYNKVKQDLEEARSETKKARERREKGPHGRRLNTLVEKLETLSEKREKQCRLTVVSVSLGSKVLYPDISKSNERPIKVREGGYLDSFLYWVPCKFELQWIVRNMIMDAEDGYMSKQKKFVMDRFMDSIQRRGLLIKDNVRDFDASIQIQAQGKKNITDITSGADYLDLLSKAKSAMSKELICSMRDDITKVKADSSIGESIVSETERRAAELIDEELKMNLEMLHNKVRELEEHQGEDPVGGIPELFLAKAEIQKLEECDREDLVKKRAQEIQESYIREIREEQMNHIIRTHSVKPDKEELAMFASSTLYSEFGSVMVEKMEESLVMHMHPMFDWLVGTLISKYSFNVFRLLVRDHMYTRQGTDDISESIALLMGLDPLDFSEYEEVALEPDYADPGDEDNLD